MDPAEQTTPAVQDPAPPEPAAPALTGPWANDLATHFTDPTQRAAVDAFLRETVQPHVTRVEQERAGLKQAEQLYSDLVANPGETFLAIAEELFDEEGATAIKNQLAELYGDGEEETTVTEPTTPPALEGDDKEAVEWAKEQRRQQAYAAEFERVKGLDDYKDIPAEDWDMFHPFVVSAEGDFDRAAQGFNQWREQVKARYAPAEEPVVEDPAPAVVAADGTTAPPVEKTYTGPGGLDNALDDFFAENRRGAPPVVGSV